MRLGPICKGGDADDDGGGVCNNDNSDPSLCSFIVWDNSATGSGDEVYNSANSGPYWGWSDLKGCGGSGGGWVSSYGNDSGGNIDDNPDFTNDANLPGSDGVVMTCDDGLSLTSVSPCIDTGLNDCNDIDIDICGGPRIIDSWIDKGAYEYDS